MAKIDSTTLPKNEQGAFILSSISTGDEIVIEKNIASSETQKVEIYKKRDELKCSLHWIVGESSISIRFI